MLVFKRFCSPHQISEGHHSFRRSRAHHVFCAVLPSPLLLFHDDPSACTISQSAEVKLRVGTQIFKCFSASTTDTALPQLLASHSVIISTRLACTSGAFVVRTVPGSTVLCGTMRHLFSADSVERSLVPLLTHTMRCRRVKV